MEGLLTGPRCVATDRSERSEARDAELLSRRPLRRRHLRKAPRQATESEMATAPHSSAKPVGEMYGQAARSSSAPARGRSESGGRGGGGWVTRRAAAAAGTVDAAAERSAARVGASGSPPKWRVRSG